MKANRGKSKISMPFLLASSLRTQKYCFSPFGWREASTANLSSFVRVRRLSCLRFLCHDKTKEGKQFIWMLSRLLMRVWFGGKGGDTWSSLSPIPFNSLFSLFLCPSPLREPAHRLSTYFWFLTFKKSREQAEYKNTWIVGFEADHAVLRQSRRWLLVTKL